MQTPQRRILMKTDSNKKNPELTKQPESIAKNDAAAPCDQDPKDSSAEFAPYRLAIVVNQKSRVLSALQEFGK